jgi:hypothetical protein
MVVLLFIQQVPDEKKECPGGSLIQFYFKMLFVTCHRYATYINLSF